MCLFYNIIMKYSINLLTDFPFVMEEAKTVPSEVRELGREFLIITIL